MKNEKQIYKSDPSARSRFVQGREDIVDIDVHTPSEVGYDCSIAAKQKNKKKTKKNDIVSR